MTNYIIRTSTTAAVSHPLSTLGISSDLYSPPQCCQHFGHHSSRRPAAVQAAGEGAAGRCPLVYDGGKYSSTTCIRYRGTGILRSRYIVRRKKHIHRRVATAAAATDRTWYKQVRKTTEAVNAALYTTTHYTRPRTRTSAPLLP